MTEAEKELNLENQALIKNEDVNMLLQRNKVN